MSVFPVATNVQSVVPNELLITWLFPLNLVIIEQAFCQASIFVPTDWRVVIFNF